MKPSIKNQKGFISQALAAGLVFLGLFAFSNASIVNESASEKADDASFQKASGYAQAGLQYALRNIDQGDDPVKTLLFDNGSAEVTVSGNQITSVGRSDIAVDTQTINANFAANCVALRCNNFHSSGTDLMGMTLEKSCLSQPTLTRMKMSLVPEEGEQISQLEIGGVSLYNGQADSDVWMDLQDYPVVNPSTPVNFIRFLSPIKGGKNYTFTAEFVDHSSIQVSCLDTTSPAVCGNGDPETGEECDDGNANNGDGCSGNCIVEPGYTCNGNPSICVLTTGPTCGNGNVETGETCDDGNNNNGDGCSSSCAIEPGFDCNGSPSACLPTGTVICGNGLVENGEGCDDGNSQSADGCSSACIVEPGYTCSGTPSVCSTSGGGGLTVICGNGLVQAGESCDDGNLLDGDGCSANCSVESGYTCNGSPSACSPIPTTVCGNGILEENELCDDGNTANADGCSFNCTVETGFICSGTPLSLCQRIVGSVCGNGAKEGEELCDDGNSIGGDGCSPLCLIESDFTCSGSPQSSCVPNNGPICGNGSVEAGEGCDDGNKNNGDGCSSACVVESGYSCTGKPSVCESTANKYCICHNTGSASNPHNTISISENAVCTHLQQHGDSAGPCPGDQLNDCKGVLPLPISFQCASIDGAACGDSKLDSGETCDDGGKIGGDGCSANCILESGYSCNGTPSVCTTTGNGGSQGMKNNGNGTLEVGKSCTAEFNVLCTSITYGAGGPDIPVKMNRALNGQYFNNWMFNNSPVKAGDKYTEAVSSSQVATYKLKGNAKYGNFAATYDSTTTSQVKTLVDGNPSPTKWAGFGGQQPVSACVAPYTDTVTKKMKLAANQAILLFELGVNTQKYPNSTAIDFQDLVVLVTAKNCP